MRIVNAKCTHTEVVVSMLLSARTVLASTSLLVGAGWSIAI